MFRVGVLVLCLCLTAVVADPARDRSKSLNDLEKKLDALLNLGNEQENEVTEQDEDDAIVEDRSAAYVQTEEDPCASIYCSAGRSCVINEEGKGVCNCVQQCEDETDPRRRVCSNHNETWLTDCDLHRQRCMCEDDRSECQDEMYKHLHINYFGQCQELPECDEEELLDFPRRMREWLFNVMRDMADRHILSNHYTKLEKEAEEDETQKWTNAVVWKWCDLDGKPKDKVVSRHELFPIEAPLYTLEHCISPFLDSCDPNDDHKITLREWGTCLELDEEDIEDMDDLCEDIREYEANNN